MRARRIGKLPEQYSHLTCEMQVSFLQSATGQDGAQKDRPKTAVGLPAERFG